MDAQSYLKAVETLNLWAKHYYVLDDPIVTDETYDKLYHEVLDFEKSHPSLVSLFSPTQRVGDVILDGFQKSEHIERMWSLDDVFDEQALQEWINRVNKDSSAYVLDPKFDGASLNLLYENGILQKAATRGDGFVGEDVTQNAKTIPSIPLHISYKGKIEIRGECIIKKDDFQKINKQRKSQNLPPFANPRNAAAGSLRQLDCKITKERKLQFIPWGVGYCEIVQDSFFALMQEIRSFGFICSPFSLYCNTKEQILAHYHKLILEREHYPIMLDGMVIRLDSRELQNQLGFTIKAPRFACAFKFPATQKQATIKQIIMQVGRTGVITPVAVFDPVVIDGAKITRATLHNFDEIAKKDIQIYDQVVLIRSGDVIPKVIQSLPHLRDGRQYPPKMPTHCPICQSQLLIEEKLIKCQNLNCKARIKNALIHFVSKKALNIDGLGKKIIDLLFEKEIISALEDIFTLRFEDLIGLEGFQEKKVNNLLEAIGGAKNLDLWRFINALGIEHIGEGASKKIAQSFGFDFINKPFEAYVELDGFGQEMAQSIVEFCHINQTRIKHLLDLLHPRLTPQQKLSSMLANKTFVITGTLSKKREDYQMLLENLGAKLSNNVSKKTDYLLCGRDAGSKLQKAKELDVAILSEDDFQKLLQKLLIDI